MKTYKLNDKLNFGEYKGSTLLEIAKVSSEYISKCIVFLSDFYITDEVLDLLYEAVPNFELSEEAIEILSQKEIELYDEDEDIDDEIDEYIERSQNSRNSREDDFIADAFGGEASAYWNIE